MIYNVTVIEDITEDGMSICGILLCGMSSSKSDLLESVVSSLLQSYSQVLAVQTTETDTFQTYISVHAGVGLPTSLLCSSGYTSLFAVRLVTVRKIYFIKNT